MDNIAGTCIYTYSYSGIFVYTVSQYHGAGLWPIWLCWKKYVQLWASSNAKCLLLELLPSKWRPWNTSCRSIFPSWIYMVRQAPVHLILYYFIKGLLFQEWVSLVDLKQYARWHQIAGILQVLEKTLLVCAPKYWIQMLMVKERCVYCVNTSRYYNKVLYRLVSTQTTKHCFMDLYSLVKYIQTSDNLVVFI